MIKDVLKIGNKALEVECSEVTSFNDALHAQVDRMWEILDGIKGGMALAANQAGFVNRVFIMNGTEGGKHVLINPKIIMMNESKMAVNEGCLSLPGVRIKTNRSAEVVVEFQNLDETKSYGTFTDMDAVCVQHEIEHLNGQNFTRHASRAQRREIERKIGKK